MPPAVHPETVGVPFWTVNVAVAVPPEVVMTKLLVVGAIGAVVGTVNVAEVAFTVGVIADPAYVQAAFKPVKFVP